MPNEAMSISYGSLNTAWQDTYPGIFLWGILKNFYNKIRYATSIYLSPDIRENSFIAVLVLGVSLA